MAKKSAKFGVEETFAATMLKSFTDEGNASRFLTKYGDEVKYCYQKKMWLKWNGYRWQWCGNGEIYKIALEYIREWRQWATLLNNEMYAKASKDIARSESRNKIENMLWTAQPQVPVDINSLDNQPDLLQAGQYTIYLHDAQAYTPQKSNLITKTAASFDPEAKCDRWIQFLDEVFEGNQDLIRYLQTAIGYSLYGGNPERLFLFFHGHSRNGKSTFCEVLMHVFKQYATKVAPSTLMAQKHEQIPNDLAGLKGARLVISQETSEGKKLNTARVKEITGNENITARYLYKEFFNYKPQFLLILSSNYKPKVDAADQAIWDRLRLIPFNRRFEGEDEDPHLGRKLKKESSGILLWLLEGHLRWREEGITTPGCVESAREEYRSEMDIIQDFLREETEEAPDDGIKKSDLHEALKKWQGKHGFREQITPTKLTRRMKGMGYQEGRDSIGNRIWQGICLSDSRGYYS